MSVSQSFSDHQIYSVDFSFFQLNSFFQIIRKFAKLLMAMRGCHACDNQSHPRPKDSPSRLVPLPSRLLQIAEITRASPLRNPYVIQHHLTSPQPNPEHHKTLPERTQPHASNNCACPGLHSPHSPPKILAKVLCCIAIFSPFPFMYIVVLASALPLSRSHLVP